MLSKYGILYSKYLEKYKPITYQELIMNGTINDFLKLKDKEFLTLCLNKLIKGLEVDLLREEDSQGKLLNNTINNDLDILTTEELLERTKSVKVDDLIKFIDRIKITNEMFFRGEENDKA